MSAEKTAKLSLNGKSYDLPMMSPVMGPDVVDIRKLYDEADVFTYDPGFTSTASCKSAITYIDGDKGELLYRGYPLEQLAAELQRSENGTLLTAQDDVWKSILGSKENDPSEDGSGVLLKVPESGLAVTKGSFTAFTIPANPKPREVYSIVIEVRLPDDVKEFRVSDLVGEVRGSDKYVQKIPYDKDAPSAAGYPVENAGIKVLTSSTVLEVFKNRVQIIVKVPGAARMVKDVIKIRSRKLKEEQELTLVFGVPASSSPNEKSSGRGSDKTSPENDELGESKGE